MADRLWKSDCGDGTYQNPILYADFSDPDVIRVGDTFYMTASTFHYTPGLPILTSKDLVNWELVNHALEKIPGERYRLPQQSCGVWAPAIRYIEHMFYIYYGMPDEGIFMVSTKDPLGKWEEPVLVLEGKGLIDPCPIWTEDGRAFVVHGYAKSRIGFKSILGIFPVSLDGKRALGEDVFLYDGTLTQPTIEGPKLFERNGYFYIFAPAGGVTTGWQTVLRSKDIYGPYEERIVMHQGDSPTNGPHQGGLVDTVDGTEWFVHFQDKGLYGRITHLQPVTWGPEGWPMIGKESEAGGIGEPVTRWEKPVNLAGAEPAYLDVSDDFQESKLKEIWQWMGNGNDAYYSLTDRPGYLRLYSKNPSGEKDVTLWNSPNILTQMPVCPYFTLEALLDLSRLEKRERAGLVIMGGQYMALAAKVVEGKKVLANILSRGEGKTRQEEEHILAELPESIDAQNPDRVWMRTGILEAGGSLQFFLKYSFDGQSFVDINNNFVPKDDTWTGVRMGLFSVAEDSAGQGYMDVKYVHVKGGEGV